MAPDFAAPVALLKHDGSGTRVAAVNQSMLACSESKDLWSFMQMLEKEEIIQRAGNALEILVSQGGKGSNVVEIMSKQESAKNFSKVDWKISFLQEGYGLLFYSKDDLN